jgi:DivIVA domain-containing protein
VEREDIERSDFPVARRGYDPASVDAHLRRVADELQTARAGAPCGSLAEGTSQQVRLILEAAEQSATQLREDAERTAGAHVARVQDAAASLVTRLDELQGELDQLLDGLRKSAEKLSEGLGELHRRAGELEAEPRAPEPEPEPVAPVTQGDEAGARIIALNMALGGSSRDETAAYLAEHFALADPDSLLDDVYAKVGQ